MADDTKTPKIDLKARLGKKTVGASGPSIPPPMATGGSIPAPPFASRAPAAPAPEPVRAEPRAIKIEMGEEVLEAQKKGRSKVIMIAIGTALVGAVLGVALGGGMERRDRQNMALEGASILAGEVDKANAEIEKLADIISRAKRSLGDGNYPEKEVNELGDVMIPFDGTYLYGKGTGLMSADVNRLLVSFAGNAQAANEQKDALKRVLGAGKSAIETLLAEKDKPKFHWSAFIVNGPHGPMASMQPLPEPFLLSSKEKVKKDGKEEDYSWPEEFEIPDGDKKVKLKRYQKGDPMSSDPVLIPIDPSTEGSVCPSDTLMRLRRELVDLENLLQGDKSDPTNEKKGLVDTGTALIDELKGIGH